jgi:hypothetical protein
LIFFFGFQTKFSWIRRDLYDRDALVRLHQSRHTFTQPCQFAEPPLSSSDIAVAAALADLDLDIDSTAATHSTCRRRRRPYYPSSFLLPRSPCAHAQDSSYELPELARLSRPL